MNYLFVCSRNKRRSLTAETIFKDHAAHSVRSAGTSDSARVKINETMINRADIIFVMERKHKQMIESRFEINKKIVVLDIPDEYEYMNEDLIEILRSALSSYF